MLDADGEPVLGVAGDALAFEVGVFDGDLGGTFDVTRFSHWAPYDAIRSRIEMRLVSDVAQTIEVGSHLFHFERGEWIVTEHAYKYDDAEVEALARRAGLVPVRAWMDSRRRVSLHELAVDRLE